MRENRTVLVAIQEVINKGRSKATHLCLERKIHKVNFFYLNLSSQRLVLVTHGCLT